MAVDTRARGADQLVPAVHIYGGDQAAAAVRLRRRIEAELRALGYQTKRMADPADGQTPAPSSCGTTVSRRVGAIRIFGPLHLIVCTANRGVTSQADLRAEDAQVALKVLSLKAVEVLRASLLRLPRWAKSSQSKTQHTPPAPSRTSETETTRRFWIGLGGMLSVSPGGLGANAHLRGDFGLRLTRWFSLMLIAMAGLTQSELIEPEGRASLWFWLSGIAGRFSLPSSLAWPVRPFVDIGVALSSLQATGIAATAELDGRVDSALSAMPYGGVGVQIPFSRHISLRSDILVGVALPRPNVRFAGREVADWGRPLVGFTLGIDVTL